MIGIYKIENTVNGKVYIGQSVDIKKRWKAHRSELCNNTLIDKRALREAKKRTHNYIIILSNDKINDMCVSCGYSCKQSAQNEIIMCKGIAERL